MRQLKKGELVLGEIRLHILLLRCTDTIFGEAANHVEYSLYALGFKFARPFVGVSCVRAEFQRSLHGSGDIEGDEVQRLLLIWVGGMGRGSHARQVVWTGNDEDFGMMLLALGGSREQKSASCSRFTHPF